MGRSSIKRAISLIFFLLSLIGNHAIADTEFLPLSNVFCNEFIRIQAQGEVLGMDSTHWELLARRLEDRSKALPHNDPLIKQYSQEIESCLKSYEKILSEAEFILGGKRLVSSSLKTFFRQVSAKKKKSSQFPTVSGMIAESVIGNILILPQEAAENLDNAEGLKEREAEYSKLWKEFLGKFRRTVSMNNATRTPAN